MTHPAAVHIRQILCPTDFSTHSDHAIDAALALADHFGARLHLLHVVHHAHEQAAARTRLAALAEERVAPTEYTAAVVTGRPGAEIVSYATREKVDLIVMATHGRTGLAHAVLGSVAEAVVRHGPCQVVTIRPAVELPVEMPEPPPERPEAPSIPAAVRRCLVCARPWDEVVCDTCKALIQAEVIYRRTQEEKAGR